MYGFQGFDDPANAEVIVIFRTVQGTDDKVHDAEMVVVGLLLCFSHFSCFFLFCLKSLHDLFSLFVLVDHDIAHTEVGYHDSCKTEHVVSVFIDYGLIITDCLIIPFKDEKYVGHVQFPSLVVGTEFCTLSEKLLHN